MTTCLLACLVWGQFCCHHMLLGGVRCTQEGYAFIGCPNRLISHCPLISSSHAIASGIRRSKKRTFTYNELSYSMLYGMGERRDGIIPSSLITMSVDLLCTNCSPCSKQRCTDANAKEACLLLWASVVSLLSWQQQVRLTFLTQNHTLLVRRET